MSGPTQAAAQQAASAQIGAAQIAAQAATQNTTSAINALMGQYGTALQMANPAINTGNQAAAQYNYMLGMPAVAPGAAPTAPTMGKAVDPTQQQIQQYVTANSTPVYNANTGALMPGVGGQQFQYTGAGARNNQADLIAEAKSRGTGTGYSDQQFAQGDYGTINNLASDFNAGGAAKQALIDQQQPGLKQAYDTANTTYQQQLAQYNQQKGVYDQYQGKGQATGSDINNVVNNLPGMQFEQQQGIQAIQNAASASGQLNSGNMLQALNQYGQGVSQKYYQNYMNNLNSLSSAGNAASQQAGAGANALGTNIAGAYGQQGATQANAALSAGQAMASSYLSPVANQQVIQTPTTSSSSSSQQGGGNLGGLLGGVGTLYGSGIFG
jgi:hypothetical protein